MRLKQWRSLINDVQQDAKRIIVIIIPLRLIEVIIENWGKQNMYFYIELN
jgi:hypothetical protein